MIESMSIGASGMHAQQLHIDVIANNLANSNTMGFKKSRVDFEDLMYRELVRNENFMATPDISKPVGAGAAIASTNKMFTTGEAKKTERDLDLAIQGDGFFEIVLPDNSYAYTRSGSFQLDQDGMLTNQDGYPLSVMVQVPSDTEDLLIKPDGRILAQVTGESDLIELGQIELAKFVNSSALNPVGDNLYRPSEQSGDALYSVPGDEGVGDLQQGFLEASNVNLVEELTNLIMAQRAYEINSKVVQASDEVLNIANNLRR